MLRSSSSIMTSASGDNIYTTALFSRPDCPLWAGASSRGSSVDGTSSRSAAERTYGKTSLNCIILHYFAIPCNIYLTLLHASQACTEGNESHLVCFSYNGITAWLIICWITAQGKRYRRKKVKRSRSIMQQGLLYKVRLAEKKALISGQRKGYATQNNTKINQMQIISAYYQSCCNSVIAKAN